jgi:hypothetical protein
MAKTRSKMPIFSSKVAVRFAFVVALRPHPLPELRKHHASLLQGEPLQKHRTDPASIYKFLKYEKQYDETDLVTNKTKYLVMPSRLRTSPRLIPKWKRLD